VTRFLNLFRSYREAVSARIEAESELRVLREKVPAIQAEVIEAKKETLEHAHRIADFVAQMWLGQRVFRENPTISDAKAPAPIESPYPRPRDKQREQWAEFAREAEERFLKTNVPNN
jgi:hypothetical protein